MAKSRPKKPPAVPTEIRQTEVINIQANHARIGNLLSDLGENKLIPRPEFQRRLVWTSKHKKAFIETVLRNLPFPEIYIATGDLDKKTGSRKQMLVDGQQRITTLYQYFTASPKLKIGNDIKKYASLSPQQQESFLDYSVVVRDLGSLKMETIKDIYRRINSTNYALNHMEGLYARFDGEFRQFCVEISEDAFFFDNNVFLESDKRRMYDLSFAITFVISLLSTYPHRNDEHEKYLEMYNDGFEQKKQLAGQLKKLFAFIEKCGFPKSSRAWKQVDLLTLLVETHQVLFGEHKAIKADAVGSRLQSFYKSVDQLDKTSETHSPGNDDSDNEISYDYLKAATRASSDKYSRAARGKIVFDILSALS